MIDTVKVFVGLGPFPRSVRDSRGQVHSVPDGWELLPPGDAVLTRRVKAVGDHWLVQQQKRGRMYSLGIWAPEATIERVRSELQLERSSEHYAKQRAAQVQRRTKTQADYVSDFQQAILKFLNFHQDYRELAEQVARAVADHATPVGSGTVARTRRIPIEQRASAAVIAWLRHRTTGYDSLVIPRVRGKRREVRRQLAAESQRLLSRFRRGEPAAVNCPLVSALRATSRGQ